MYLFLALLLIPIMEIALFIKIGGAIGLMPTLLIVIGTAMAGSWLIRRQGLGAMQSLRGQISTMSDPTRPLFDGAAILVAGVLLLTPGFLTDTLGLLLLVPPIRAAIYRSIRSRITVVGTQSTGPARARPTDVIDGEYHVVEQDDPRH